jgi:hypothetical protein
MGLYDRPNTNLPEKGQRVRISGSNSSGQRFPAFEGIVEGIEFRTNPPILSVVTDDHKRRDIVNLGYGSNWQPVA